MFLTVGEKIRQARQQFDLKQGVFRNFGITQHYLSMIETNKRQAPEQTLNDIYDAFLTLTDGRIQELYSFEEFCLPIEKQVTCWLEDQLRADALPDKYDDLLSIAQTYKLGDYVVQLDELMGELYFKAQDYSLMTYHYRRAVANSMNYKVNPAFVYLQFGICLRKIGKYDEAILNFCLACSMAKEMVNDHGIIYDSKIYLALTYHRMKEYRLGLEAINHLLEEIDLLENHRYAAAMIIKESCVRRLDGPEVSVQYLESLLECPEKYKSELHHIYHNLGWNYLESKQYEKALDVLNKALFLREKPLHIALTTLLVGHIYFEMEEYEKAQNCYELTKDFIFNSNSIRTKRLWIDEQLDLYCKLNKVNKIKELFEDLGSLVREGKFPENLLYELKSTIYKRFVQEIIIRHEEYHFLYNFFAL